MEDRYINKSSHNKNVEAIMTFKKNCSNVIKVCLIIRYYYPVDQVVFFLMLTNFQFSSQNIPYAVIQVKKKECIDV
jgi:hypothetical protein